MLPFQIFLSLVLKFTVSQRKINGSSIALHKKQPDKIKRTTEGKLKVNPPLH
jgi:hypothetical protein